MDAVNGGEHWQQFDEGFFETGGMPPNAFFQKRESQEDEEVAPTGGRLVPVESPLFDGDTVLVKVTRNVNPNQLVWEIDEKLGDRDRYQIAMEHAGEGPISAKNPLLLHIHPADTDVKVVNAVIKAHVADEHWGRSDEEQEIVKLKERLKDGDLALPELNKILRSIIGG